MVLKLDLDGGIRFSEALSHRCMYASNRCMYASIYVYINLISIFVLVNYRYTYWQELIESA